MIMDGSNFIGKKEGRCCIKFSYQPPPKKKRGSGVKTLHPYLLISIYRRGSRNFRQGGPTSGKF